MSELTYSSVLIAGLSLLALGVGAYIYHQQQKKRANQKAKQQAQDFAHKQSRIIREIAARLPPEIILASNTIELATEPDQNAQTSALTQDGQVNTPCLQRAGHQTILYASSSETRGETSTNTPEPLENMEPLNSKTTPTGQQGLESSTKSSPQTMITTKSSVPPIPKLEPQPKLQPSTSPRLIETPKGQIIKFHNSTGPDPKRGRGVKLDFHLKLEDSLYQQIKDYAQWIASQSDHFSLRYRAENQPEQHIQLIFNQNDLDGLNGHWFDLFRPINIDEVITHINTHRGKIICPFTEQALDQLSAPARQIVKQVEEKGTSRYKQVLKESALGEFIKFIDELKTIMVVKI